MEGNHFTGEDEMVLSAIE